jgi:Zn-dependent protease with chaperone function
VRCGLGWNIEKEVDLGKINNDTKDEEKEAWSTFLEYLGTHPYISNRIQQLKDFNRS